tara:strand:+ start:6988 stop:7098 length:111 start_codon:yes stop_codon:yes gene_type:complete
MMKNASRACQESNLDIIRHSFVRHTSILVLVLVDAR